MRHKVYTFLGLTGLLVVAQVCVAGEGLTLSTQNLAQCQQQAKQRAVNEVRAAIAHNELDHALSLLSKPTQSTPVEQRYLYGKVLFLQAYARVARHEVEKPDTELLTSATAYIQAAAKLGLGEALYDEAMLLTPADQAERRLDLLRQAANKQYVPAMMQLAEEYFLSSQTYERRVDAQALIQKAAELDTTAKLRLAEYYLHEDKRLTNTTGYDKNIDKAIQLYFEAAQACDGRGAFSLYALAESKHKPNSLDPASAIYWLGIAGELGLAEAQAQLAEYYLKTESKPTEAIVWAERAAANGNVTGMIVLGNIYYQGNGVEKDHVKAMQYFEQALKMDQDNRHVQDQLGMMYYKGEGMPVDFRKAAEFCKVAANKGQPGCQYYLGLMYVNGEGVTQDIDRGIGWIRKSAAQEFSIAKNWLRENW